MKKEAGKSKELVKITDLQNLDVNFNIVDVSYNISQEKVEVTFNLEVSCPLANGRYLGKRDFKVVIDRMLIQKVKKTFEERKVEVDKALEEIKEKIRSLQVLRESVDVALDEITDQLIKVAKKGLVFPGRS